MSTFEVTELRSLEDFEALAPEWPALADRFGTPLLNHDWFACAAGAFHREADLRVVVVRDGATLCAVAPLAFDSSRRLVLVGSPSLNEPSGLVYSSDAALRVLTATLMRMGSVIAFDRLPAGSPICALLPQLARWHALTITRQATGSFAVATDTAWEPYVESLSARTRKTLANARARAEREAGPVQFVRLVPQPHEVDDVLSQVVRIEGTGWKGRNGSALASRARLLTFFCTYAHRAAAQGRLRFSVLRFGETAVAAELGVEAYGRMWGLKLAYDERFAACVPGLQLVHHSIAAANTARLIAYEFLGSAESWQQRWRPERRSYRATAVYPFSIHALLTAVRDAAALSSRRALRMTRADHTVGVISRRRS